MKKLVICGCTGKQGGAVFDAMQNLEDLEITGFTRDLEQTKVKELKARGLTMLKGDLADLVSLEKVFQGADAVFGLTQPWNKSYTTVDTELELNQGKNIVDACLKADVKHLVFSSAAHGEVEKTGLPHVDIKIDIEEYTRASGLGYTFLNPVQFMDNVGMRFLPVKKGRIRGFIDGNAKVPYVAVRDIGLMAKIAFKGGEDFFGREIPLIGDLVTGKEMAALFSKIRDERFKYKDVPRWIIRLLSKEFYMMRLKFEEAGTNAETIERFDEGISECRSIHPNLFSMEAYLKWEGWDRREL